MMQMTKIRNWLTKLFIGWIIFLATIACLSSVLAVALMIYVVVILNQKFQLFLAGSQLSATQFIDLVEPIFSSQTLPRPDSSTTNILVLGVDSLSTRGNVPPLTDTMMIGHLNFDTNQIFLSSLPRDLWLPAYLTKINALYAYGLERYPDQPATFPQTVLSESIGQPISDSLILSLDQLAQIVDLIGGVEIEVPTSFIDPEFPRPDVDITTQTDPAILYQTVEFTAGPELMTSDRVLQYVRSRHSNGEEGSDLARANRQQLVIKALTAKLADPAFYWTAPDQAGKLFNFYLTNFSQDWPLTKIVTYGLNLLDEPPLTITRQSPLDVADYDPKSTNSSHDYVLIHPANSEKMSLYQNQWVYLIKDPQSWQNFFKFTGAN